MARFHSALSTIRLDILLVEEDGAWIGHCLQLDLVTSGTSQDEAYHKAIDVCAEHIRFAFAENRLEHLFVPQGPVLLKKMFEAQLQGCLRIELGREVGPELEFQRLAAA